MRRSADRLAGATPHRLVWLQMCISPALQPRRCSRLPLPSTRSLVQQLHRVGEAVLRRGALRRQGAQLTHQLCHACLQCRQVGHCARGGALQGAIYCTGCGDALWRQRRQRGGGGSCGGGARPRRRLV